MGEGTLSVLYFLFFPCFSLGKFSLFLYKLSMQFGIIIDTEKFLTVIDCFDP